MKYICDGMEYNFNPDTRLLTNNYGVIVAYSDKSECGEYINFYDWDTRDLLLSTHENNIKSNYQLGGELVCQYVAFNQ
jgi:hypothetical protein